MRPPAARPARSIALRPASALAALVVLGLAGCGGDGVTLPTALPSGLPSISLPERTTTPSPTLTDSAEPTSEAPSETPTTESPTSEATVTEQPAETPSPEGSDIVALPPSSESPSESPTPTEERTSEPPTESPTPTEEPTSESPTPTPSETVEPSASEQSPTETASSSPPEAGTPTATPGEGEGEGSLPIWIPIVAVLGLVGGAILLLIGRSRSRRWDERLEVERAQAQWVRDELLPAMTNPATPVDALATHWAGAQPTLDQLQEGLAGVIADAPDAARSSRAQGLADAVSEVRQAVAADLALRGSAQVDPAALASSAARVASSRDRLTAALTTAA